MRNVIEHEVTWPVACEETGQISFSDIVISSTTKSKGGLAYGKKYLA